jgi:hypothetical protein
VCVGAGLQRCPFLIVLVAPLDFEAARVSVVGGGGVTVPDP